MKYLIRTATENDNAEIGRLYEKAFEHTEGSIRYYAGFGEYMSFFIEKNNAFVICNEENDIICGAVLVYETPDMFCGRSLYIDFLAVLPEYQNKGLGKTLIEYVYDEARKRGITEVSIRTACYKDAYLIYRHMGFRDTQGNCQYLTMNLKRSESKKV